MTAYIKLDERGVIVQKQPYAEQGFIAADNRVVCGMMLQDGKFVIPSQSPQPVPPRITRAQGKAALIQAGLWPQVLAYVDGIVDPTEKALAEVALNDTTEWLPTSPFLSSVSVALGLSPEQLYDLFRTAATIEL